MNRFLLLGPLTVLLVACSHDPSGVRITQKQASVIIQAPARSEPVFYNGKTYQVNFAPASSGGYDMSVSGMNAGQQKDAVAVTTSSLRQFACKGKESGKLLNEPNFVSGLWRMTVHCV